MTRLVTSALLLALAATPALATHPTTGRVEKKAKQRSFVNERQTGVRDDDIIDTSNPSIGELIVAVVLCPNLQNAHAIEARLGAEYRMRKLLNESHDLAAARAEARRFWMNDQPKVLTYERLDGAIGP